MKSSFTTGFFMALFAMGLIQDYIGQEAYIQFLTVHWINISWQWYLIPLVYLNVELFQNERYNRLLLKLIPIGNPDEFSFSAPPNPSEGDPYTDVKGNEYVFINNAWRLTKNIKEELAKIDFSNDAVENLDMSDKDVSWVADFNGSPMRMRNTGPSDIDSIKPIPPKEET
jgi:hypothetical protein